MHLLVRERQSLDELAQAVDLEQSPGDLVLLSFSDSELGAAAAAWKAMPAPRPRLRLANLRQLRHPMSVDTYLDRLVAHAKCVIVRILGGFEYWRYGVEEISALCGRSGIPLALLAGDDREDARLAGLSTVPADALTRIAEYLRQGGPENLRRLLRFAGHLAGMEADVCGPAVPMPDAGVHSERLGEGPLAVVVFYRSHLLSGDIEPIEALTDELHRRGFSTRSLYVKGLKDPAAGRFVADALAAWRPAVVVNATGFSARSEQARQSPLDVADVPVLQVILAGSTREAWERDRRGLDQANFAMQVVLPDLDGRLTTAPISFKAEDEAIGELEFARVVHRPYFPGIKLTGSFASRWARLARTPSSARRIAIVLSDYPGVGGQAGHAVGLDSFASVEEIVGALGAAGYDVGAQPFRAQTLCGGAAQRILSLAHYARLAAALPEPVRARIAAAWGEATDDPMVLGNSLWVRHVRAGNLVVAIQPDRGHTLDRKASFHDPDLPPRHGYVGFYLWLREVVGVHAIIHLGAHGTTEWLPGKAVALSEECFPAALLDGLPVVYPFVVSNPGEAAAAKRRLGAVVLGHLTPPLKPASAFGEAAELEKLIDEYAAADGLDQRRMALMRDAILERARENGLFAETGISHDAPAEEVLARLDAYLCDVKDLQIRDGLHVFGRAPATEMRERLLQDLNRSCPGAAADQVAAQLDASPRAEMMGLLAALNGRFVPPGPSGSPTRGRIDVLPTGRNLYTVDPRAIPTRSATVLAGRAADELLRRHVQDHGSWPGRIVIDLWGSTTMRTGGEDLALGFVLMGCRLVWDEESGRISGFEVIPLAEMDRPRVDVCLRISGLFRDAFEVQLRLFDAAVRTVAARDEPAKLNPLAAFRESSVRIYGAAPGAYGAGVAEVAERGAWRNASDLGAAYMAASAYAYGAGQEGAADSDGFASRLAAADAFVHQIDDPASDVLDTTELASHVGGFAAAAATFGSRAALYSCDLTRAGAPRVRTMREEIVRAVRGRAANPDWIAGMKRHGYRGAAEIARGVEPLFLFAATLNERMDRQFDLLFDATLGDDETARFLQENNPAARTAMAARFAEALKRGLWITRRNAVSAILAREAEP